MSETTVWVGIDLGLRRSCICIVDALGAELLNDECDTNLRAFKEVMSSFPIEQIGLIATEAGNHVNVARKLRDAGYPVAVFETRQTSKFLALRPNKTDAGDARGLADLARLGRETISQVHLKSPECQQLRGLLVMRQRIVMMRVAGDAIVRARLASHGLAMGSARGMRPLQQRVDNVLTELPKQESLNLREDLEPLITLCDSLRRYLKKLNLDVERAASSEPICRRFMEVPGVGALCALSFYTAIEDPSRFRSAARVGSYLGLAPRRRQSGATSRSFGITKTGSKMTRWNLVTAAMVFGNAAPDCELKRWYLALRDRAGTGRARVALARKLAVILLTMWKNGTHFELNGTTTRRATN